MTDTQIPLTPEGEVDYDELAKRVLEGVIYEDGSVDDAGDVFRALAAHVRAEALEEAAVSELREFTDRMTCDAIRALKEDG